MANRTLAIRKPLQFSFQLFLVTIGKIVLPFTERQLELPNQTLSQEPLIVAANHKRATDPFLIMSALPFRAALKVLPVSFMTYNGFYDSPLKPFLWLCGSFPARNPKGQHKVFGIEGANILLAHGFSIFIFPEGKRIHSSHRGKAHYGVVNIHQANAKIPMLLCRIRYRSGLKKLSMHYKLIEKPNYRDPQVVLDDIFSL